MLLRHFHTFHNFVKRFLGEIRGILHSTNLVYPGHILMQQHYIEIFAIGVLSVA